MEPLPSITERLQKGEAVSTEEVYAQQQSIAEMTPEKRQALRAAVDKYVERNKAVLSQSVATEQAWLALRQTLADKENTERGPLEKMSMQTGQVVGGTADRMVQDAKEMSYREWKKMMDPEEHWHTRVFGALGILSTIWGLYRLARWVKGKKTDSFFGKALKLFGVTAGAGLLYNWLSPKNAQTLKQKNTPPQQNESKQTNSNRGTELPTEESPKEVSQDVNETQTTPSPEPTGEKPYDDGPDTIYPSEMEVPNDYNVIDDTPSKPPVAAPAKSPVAAPVAVRKAKPDTKSDSLLSAFPERQNLIGQKATTINLDGGTHSIGFRKDDILIDGVSYYMKRSKRDVEFNSVIREGNAITFGGSVNVKITRLSGESKWTENELRQLLIELLLYGKFEDKKEGIVISKFSI